VTVKRSGREARSADIPPARTRWLFWRRDRAAVEPRPAPPPELAVEVPEPPPVERALAPPPASEWNIWDLERQARAQAGDAAQDEEWKALFMHLRQFANADGVLPKEFDGLVRESFSELIQAA
jgi:hypothetical protein